MHVSVLCCVWVVAETVHVSVLCCVWVVAETVHVSVLCCVWVVAETVCVCVCVGSRGSCKLYLPPSDKQGTFSPETGTKPSCLLHTLATVCVFPMHWPIESLTYYLPKHV